MTRLVSPLEAFDGRKTERGGGRKITPGETLQRGFALKVHLSLFVHVCARVKCMQVPITRSHAARTPTPGLCESFRRGGGGGR